VLKLFSPQFVADLDHPAATGIYLLSTLQACGIFAAIIFGMVYVIFAHNVGLVNTNLPNTALLV